MRRLPIAVLVVGCGSAATSPAPPSNHGGPDATASLTGRYTVQHEIELMGSDCAVDGCTERVTDTLRVTENADSTLTIDVALTQANAHSCGFTGTLVGRAQATDELPWRWVYSAPGDADDGPCELTLAFDGRDLDLSADGCRYYCGARASLDASFAYPPGDADPGADADAALDPP